jgi:DNA-binding response OmpR family regulator
MQNDGKPRILVVEDDPVLRKILRLQLSGEGFEISLAEDGAIAYDLLQTMLPDCIILDLMMPVMDGFSFLKRVRSVNLTADIPILVLTASEDERHKRRSDQYQADAFLCKPYNLQELITTLHRLCAGSGVDAG